MGLSVMIFGPITVIKNQTRSRSREATVYWGQLRVASPCMLKSSSFKLRFASIWLKLKHKTRNGRLLRVSHANSEQPEHNNPPYVRMLGDFSTTMNNSRYTILRSSSNSGAALTVNGNNKQRPRNHRVHWTLNQTENRNFTLSLQNQITERRWVLLPHFEPRGYAQLHACEFASASGGKKVLAFHER